ncbi:hypothetical protein DFH09DRAFT_1084777 [Mycena vulgaris]|nr:hypothetical protein DFH09DRAFT_1084777 [Mycena vulgaris]
MHVLASSPFSWMYAGNLGIRIADHLLKRVQFVFRHLDNGKKDGLAQLKFIQKMFPYLRDQLVTSLSVRCDSLPCLWLPKSLDQIDILPPKLSELAARPVEIVYSRDHRLCHISSVAGNVAGFRDVRDRVDPSADPRLLKTTGATPDQSAPEDSYPPDFIRPQQLAAMSVISWFWDVLIQLGIAQKHARIVILGLDNAGKTLLIARSHPEPFAHVHSKRNSPTHI